MRHFVLKLIVLVLLVKRQTHLIGEIEIHLDLINVDDIIAAIHYIVFVIKYVEVDQILNHKLSNIVDAIPSNLQNLQSFMNSQCENGNFACLYGFYSPLLIFGADLRAVTTSDKGI